MPVGVFVEAFDGDTARPENKSADAASEYPEPELALDLDWTGARRVLPGSRGGAIFGICGCVAAGFDDAANAGSVGAGAAGPL